MWIFIADFYKKICLFLRVSFILICTWGGTLIFSLQMASPRAYFWRMQREVFARWSGDLLHRDDYERLKWPRKKILLPEKNLRIVPEKVYCQPEKKIKKSGREISKMGEKTAKKAGKIGRESRFLPEKKVKISPKYCFSGTLPFLGQKKSLTLHTHTRVVSIFW